MFGLFGTKMAGNRYTEFSEIDAHGFQMHDPE